MLFNSFDFIFMFLPIVLIGYYLFNRFNHYEYAKTLLVVASLYFYAFFNVSYLPIILSSIVVNYSVASMLHKAEERIFLRKSLLWIGVIFNVGILGYFKYSDFFISNINYIFSSEISLLKLLLPLGISFFTFQQLAYVVDAYHRKRDHDKFLDYALFVTFFPQLIAGPIVLPDEMLPQFADENNKRVNWDNIARGVFLFSVGLAKKMLLADTLSKYSEHGFSLYNLSFADAWVTSLSYTFQLYLDFSGYCDMAMGIALLFNIKLPQNFLSPYLSPNIQQFWKRWHATLGRFLTHYLYIPLGGNRKGPSRTMLNLWLVFLVSGIWHGAGWTFIIWGAMHGLAIVIHRYFSQAKLSMPNWMGIIITFITVNILWVYFRADSVEGANRIVKSMFDITKTGVNIDFIAWAKSFSYGIHYWVLALITIFLFPTAYERAMNLKFKLVTIFEIVFYFTVSVLFLNKVATFLYFNF